MPSKAKPPGLFDPDLHSARHIPLSNAPSAIGGIIPSLFDEKRWRDSVRVKASAFARWDAVPAAEKQRVRDSVDAGSEDFLARFQELEAGLEAPFSDEELGLVMAYRRGGIEGARAWLKANGEQARRGAEADDINRFLIGGWYADEGFSLCWMSKAALLKALITWGYLKKSKDDLPAIEVLEKRLKRNGLHGLPSPVVDVRRLKVRLIGNRSVLEVS
jgi:hypothetical protein